MVQRLAHNLRIMDMDFVGARVVFIEEDGALHGEHLHLALKHRACHGVPMIRRAFHKETGPLRDRGQEEAEREALMHLVAGAVGSYKNPHSHRNVAMEDAGETIEVVTLASHLLASSARGGRHGRKDRQMRRDPDLEREILLAIEAYDGEAAPGYADLSGLQAPELQVKYQVALLHKTGLIHAIDAATLNDRFALMPIRLTMAGHEYLDTVRDEEVWRRTNEGARAVGSLSLEALGALARGLVREKIRQHTGVEVDL